ncbi:MAG TPA: permease [Noviherbaspirillum sp.]|nr:permease [Noviherbaspirillum sp.]
MQRVLSFEQPPALSLPLRFFLIAPAFAILAGLLLLWRGPEMLVSRWTPETLAFTHLLTLGFLSMCMIGALLQILPVVAGLEHPFGQRSAIALPGMLASGTFALTSAFFLVSSFLFKAALLLLLSCFAWFLLALLKQVWTAPHAGPMLVAIRLALTALAAAVAFGASAAAGFAWPLSLPLLQLTDLHASWGLLGWVGLLVAGIAYQVVPMFQVTPVYPQWMTRGFAWTVFALLALRTVASVRAADSIWSATLTVFLAMTGVLFGLTTLHLLRQRKRPKPDATTFFWRTALSSLIAAALLWTAGTLFPQIAGHPSYALAVGMLAIVGFGYSVVNGMLYKIIPFLVWYHLQQRLTGGCAKAPNVRQILPDQDAERQFRLHLLALVLLVLATVFPDWFSQISAIAFTASSVWLWRNLLKAVRLYRDMTSDPSTLRAAT